MGTGHTHPLFLERDSVVHRLAPEVKIVCSVAVTVAVVLTPREQLWAFAGYAALLLAVAALARVRPGWLGARMLIEVPFVALAVVLPFTGSGERVDWLGLSLTVDGLYGAWNILAKGTLGVVSSLLLAATTPGRDLLVGLQRLRTPGLLVQIATFMLRYAEVVAGQARRMRIARLARGDDPRFLWQLRATATSVGTLFLRSYERGERVYLAMLSRGYDGRMPALAAHRAGPAQWAASLAVPATAAAVLAAALVAA
jgi:cobalt/nickel transport system permease protein